jgi:D-glycero-D-manno-heptose 1,7-bisphosphate phosphatase
MRKAGSPARALFLDRDGVINIDTGFVWRPQDFVFTDGVFTACRRARALGYRLVVVTNQSGIGRGLYSEDDFNALTAWMCGRFAEEGVDIARVYFAPTHPEHAVGRYRVDSPDRKPGPGMLLRAAADLGLDLATSALVGDRETDIRAAHAAGVPTKLLIPHHEEDLAGTLADAIVGSLAEAVDWLEARDCG